MQLVPIVTSKNTYSDNKNVIKIDEVDKIQQPLIPINLPKEIEVKKPKKGRIKIEKYILNYLIVLA